MICTVVIHYSWFKKPQTNRVTSVKPALCAGERKCLSLKHYACKVLGKRVKKTKQNKKLLWATACNWSVSRKNLTKLKLKAKEAIPRLKSVIFSTNSQRPLWPAHISHQPTGTVPGCNSWPVHHCTRPQWQRCSFQTAVLLVSFPRFPPLHCLNQEGDPAGVLWHLLFLASRSGEDPPGHVLCPDDHWSSHRVWELHQPEQVIWGKGFPPRV